MTKPPPDVDALTVSELKRLLFASIEEIAALRDKVTSLSGEIARLKGLKAKPDIKASAQKPSGMERATEKAGRKANRKRRRGPKKPTVAVEERVIAVTDLPAGSRFKGYETFTIQDLLIQPRVVCYRRERWLTPDGRTVVAPLPTGINDHFGPELKRFIIAQYHQGQTTIPRLVELLQMFGMDISERQVVRILTGSNETFVAEAQAVLRAGLIHGKWISVDDTGARHQGKNGVCTQIGNDAFTFFATTFSKSRVNFLGLLRAGHGDYVLNDEAFEAMRHRGLADSVIATLAGSPAQSFVDATTWEAHLDFLGIGKPGARAMATEGALWGAIRAHGFLDNAVVLSDDAGQFNVGTHALCWVHAERLVHKLIVFSPEAIKAKEMVRQLIWWFYADLKAFAVAPTAPRKAMMKARFDRIFRRQTSFEVIDSLLARLHANKDELLRVLDHPYIPLHTNGSENDIRCQVTRRKISGTTRSDEGRDGKDAFLGLGKTCRKLRISFWEFLGSRLGAVVTNVIPPLSDLVAASCCA
jgi:hypothetical protein